MLSGEDVETGTSRLKRGLAEMLRGVIMDVVTADQAKIAEDAAAVAVMASERIPAEIRAQDGVTGVPPAKVIHNFSRADMVDRDALARLVASISRFLHPAQAIGVAHAGEIEVCDSQRIGGAWVLDQLWQRCGIAAALHRVAAQRRLPASDARASSTGGPAR
jgi:pyridoxal biosynthesis lyase PdxS